ncbi:hypothetical protein B0H21DRAFT_878914 [Amylocystis lapponica]|nr:hypothetical protein B0H21DRAFT_878914 [Amylocystis lapponica]
MSGYHRSARPGVDSHRTHDASYNGYGTWYEDVHETPIPTSSQSLYQSATDYQQEGTSGPRDVQQFDHSEGRHYTRRIDMHRRDRDAYAHHSRYVVNGSSSPPREPDPRSVTPPPPRSPSPTYLALTEGSSSHLPDPTKSRKLLILDLNGTLVFRSNVRSKVKPEKIPGENWHFLPRLRPVHPRPYMPAFRSYLFASETRAWLDVMVWSSAQPHSVNDMVERCFHEQKEHLVAVWARDTLGLSEDHYRRKVQTVKDLAKPWAQLPSLLTHSDPSPASSTASTPRSSPPPSSVTQDEKLQPYNHVCIGEYSAERRAKDLESLALGSDWQPATKTADVVPEENRADELPPRGSSEPDRDDAAQDDTTGPHDETLLAVVGVLDAIKHESNVAAWIRGGGLWGPAGAPVERGRIHADGPSAAQSRGPEEAQRTQMSDPNDDDDASTGHARSSADARMPAGKKRKHREVRAAAEADDKAGNDMAVAADTAPQSPARDVADLSVDAAEVIETPSVPAMWFEDPSTLAFWAGRGREALQQLGIPVEHGIER